MIARARAAGVPFRWVASDSIYGVGAVEMDVRRAGEGYVLGVAANRPFWSWHDKPEVAGTAEEIARGLDAAAWQRRSAGAGTKGARLFDWADLELADLDAEPFGGTNTGLWTRGLLIGRNIGDGKLAYFTTWCPAGTGIATLVAVAGHRWAIEDGFETAKTEFGLDHNETRSWHGRHRHVSLVMLAFAMMAAIRRQANPPAPPKMMLRRTPSRPSSAGRSRKSAASPCAWRSVASSPLRSSPGRSSDALIKPPRSDLTRNGICNCSARAC